MWEVFDSFDFHSPELSPRQATVPDGCRCCGVASIARARTNPQPRAVSKLALTDHPLLFWTAAGWCLWPGAAPGAPPPTTHHWPNSFRAAARTLLLAASPTGGGTGSSRTGATSAEHSPAAADSAGGSQRPPPGGAANRRAAAHHPAGSGAHVCLADVKGAGPTQAGPFYGDCPFALHVLNRTRHLTCMFCVF